MAETVAEKKTRLDKLAEQKAAIEAKMKAEKERLQRLERKARTAENAKSRKERNKQIFDYGGLVDVAGLLGADKGAVLGVLLWASRKFKEDPASIASFKKNGDEVLAEREKSRKPITNDNKRDA